MGVKLSTLKDAALIENRLRITEEPDSGRITEEPDSGKCVESGQREDEVQELISVNKSVSEINNKGVAPTLNLKDRVKLATSKSRKQKKKSKVSSDSLQGVADALKSVTKCSKSKLDKEKRYKKLFPLNIIEKGKKNRWGLRVTCARLSKEAAKMENENASCVCTSYRNTDAHYAVASTSAEEDALSLIPLLNSQDDSDDSNSVATEYADVLPEGEPSSSLHEHQKCGVFCSAGISMEDCDELARIERAKEIEEGVDAPPGISVKSLNITYHPGMSIETLAELFRSALSAHNAEVARQVHTQVDFIHCLVPDLAQITGCSFYWGKIDRYEAEKLLENKPEGTFLLRDSAQEDYLFSVSFRKYGRSLHARIEQWNHKFSFDSHDPGVFASSSVCGLIEHYKDPTCCMFFEPMLTIPLHRNFTFSLQHLCRAVICDQLTYDSVGQLKLPKSLKSYLKEYHYKQRVRVRKFENEP